MSHNSNSIDVRASYQNMVEKFKRNYGHKLTDFFLEFVKELPYSESFIIKGVNLNNGNIIFDNAFKTALGEVSSEIFCDDVLTLLIAKMVETERERYPF